MNVHTIKIPLVLPVFIIFLLSVKGQVLNQSSYCYDMPRNTVLGLGTSTCRRTFSCCTFVYSVWGCSLPYSMNCIQLTGLLAFYCTDTLLFLAALFMVAALAEGSRVTLYNSYSANLVETGHLLTIFSMGLVAFASGRLHVRYYNGE